MPRLRLDPFSPSGVSIVADSPRAKQQNGYVTRTEKLSQISDVDALTPSNGQALAYNSTTKTWRPTTISGGTGGGTTLPADAAGWLHDDGIGTLAWTTPAKSDVGLSNVDNTSDANKPVSTATQTAINGKENTITAGTSAQYYRGDKTMQTLNQDAVPSGTTNKAYTATEQAKLAAITGTNTGDQDLSSYATTSSVTTGLAAKQNTLVSGTSIKTINSTSLLGSGDIVISGGTTSDATTTAKGIVQLAGDLGGTAASPTTPTAVHIAGNEVVAGEKTFSNLQHNTLGDIDLNGMTIYKPAAQHNWFAQETVLQNFQSGHGWIKQSAAGTQADDTTNYIRGTQSLKLTTDGIGSTIFTRSTTLAPVLDLTGKQLKMWFYIDRPDLLTTLRLEFTSDAFASAWYNWFPTSDISQIKANTWVPLTFTFGRGCTLNGTPNRASINKIQFLAIDNNSGTPVNINFGGISSFTEPREGVVSITFDDGWDNQYTTARPKMDQYNFKGTAYIITDSLHHDTTGYMTTTQMTTLQKSGWDISCHTNTHPYLSQLTPAQIESEFYTSKNWLLKNGFTRGADDMALPHGDYDEATVLPIARKYFRSIRTTATAAETLPAASLLKLRTYLVTNLTTTTLLQAAIDSAKNNKEWLIITFHRIVTTPTVDTEFSTANFNTIIDYLATSTVPVRTISEVLNNYAVPTIPESAVTNLTTDLAAKQATLSLTTTGTSGAATLTGATLNIPQYSSGSGTSGITRSVSSISANTTAGATALTDYNFIATGAITLTLPTAIGNTNRYSVTTTDGLTTVATTSTQTINGSTTATMPIANMTLTFISNNANWIIE